MERVIPPLSPAVEGLFMALVIFQALQEMCILEDLIDQRDGADAETAEIDALKELEDDSSIAFSESDGERDEIDFDFEGASIPDLFEDSEEDEDEDELMRPSSSEEDSEESESESEFSDAQKDKDFLYDDDDFDVDVDLFDSDDDGYEEDSEVSSNGKKAVPISFSPLQEEIEREKLAFRKQQILSMMDEIKQGKVAEFQQRVRMIDFDLNDLAGNYNFGYGTLFENAAAYGSKEIFQLLLELAPDLNDDTSVLHQSIGYIHPSLLSTAIVNKNWEVVKVMIHEGANVNEYGFNGSSATSMAILSGNVEMAEFFIDHGADINASNKYNYPALSGAADNGDEVATRMLLERNANVNLRPPGGMSALHLAARKGHTKVARSLLRYRADCTAKTKTGETPADMAMNRGSFELAREIAESL